MTGELRIDVTAAATPIPRRCGSCSPTSTRGSVWGRWSEAGLEQPGTADPAGVGAIRRFKLSGRVTREDRRRLRRRPLGSRTSCSRGCRCGTTTPR